MNTYYFEGIEFVPGYNDFDFSEAWIKADTEEEAWDRIKKGYWKSVYLVSINDEPVNAE